MKFSILSTAFALATLFANVAAIISLESFPELVQIGQNYTLRWNATGNYTYTIWLIREKPGNNEFSWARVQGLASNLYFGILKGSYTFNVPSNITTNANYALWINGFPIPFNGSSFIEQTEWFRATNASIPTTSASASTTTSGSPRQTSSSSAVPTPHHSLSGGAIAGIVIGILILIALIIGGVFFMIWRRRKAEVRRREHQARAERLEPVMHEGSASFEMHGRSPKPIK